MGSVLRPRRARRSCTGHVGRRGRTECPTSGSGHSRRPFPTLCTVAAQSTGNRLGDRHRGASGCETWWCRGRLVFAPEPPAWESAETQLASGFVVALNFYPNCPRVGLFGRGVVVLDHGLPALRKGYRGAQRISLRVDTAGGRTAEQANAVDDPTDNGSWSMTRPTDRCPDRARPRPQAATPSRRDDVTEIGNDRDIQSRSERSARPRFRHRGEGGAGCSVGRRSATIRR